MSSGNCSIWDIGCALDWLRDEFQSFSMWLWEKILSSIATAFESIPVPGFLLDVGSYSLPETVSWAISPFNIEIGFGIIVSAYVSRFIIRRLPIVG
jgi:hypothetical protein